MIDREKAEAILRRAYDARVRGDVDGLMRHFTEGAHFSMSGSPAASRVPQAASGAGAIGESMSRLVAAFEFRSVELVSLLLDGDKAAAHWRIRLRSTATGEEAETELVDLVRFDGERIASLRQFADTALASRMLGQ